jgi:hypothetical protein
MSTPASGSSPYCSPQTYLTRCDKRFVGQLLSDSGAPVAAADIPTHPMILALLSEASGMVESAATVGEMYVISGTRNDLQALTHNSAEYLAGMVAALTTWLLWSRRPNFSLHGEKPPAQAEMAMAFLDDLRDGKRVLGLTENMQSGVAQSEVGSKSDDQTTGSLLVIAAPMLGRRAVVDKLRG